MRTVLYTLAIIVLGVLSAAAEDSRAQQRAAVVAAMQSSMDKQRAAIETQIQALQRVTYRPTVATIAGAGQCEPMPKSQIDPLIDDAAKKEGVKADLLRAVIEQESAYRPCAVSPKGAMGLMQLMPATADRFKIRNPFEPKENVDVGAKFLKELLTRYKDDLSLALGAYNAGPGAVDATAAVPPIPETQDYVKSILAKISSQ